METNRQRLEKLLRALMGDENSKEIQKALALDEEAVRELCYAEGLDPDY
jgi:hypothetical protein